MALDKAMDLLDSTRDVRIEANLRVPNKGVRQPIPSNV